MPVGSGLLVQCCSIGSTQPGCALNSCPVIVACSAPQQAPPCLDLRALPNCCRVLLVIRHVTADTNWDYGGSCGRCYEVRCKSGLVLDKGAPVKTTQFFDMGKANPNFVDSKGRKWPGGWPSLPKQCLLGC